MGQLACRVPLAANDPHGAWQVKIQEVLKNTESTGKFVYNPPLRARAIAGATPRAVSYGNDRDNVFRFARMHHDVTLVKGTSSFNATAAERIARMLQPWGIRCKVMELAEAAKSRPLAPDEARTWVGLIHAGTGQLKPGDGNPPIFTGFAVQGPVILLGNPEDHPIIKFLLAEKFLPYTPVPGAFPGTGRGMLAWQRDGVGAGQESITLIAHDAAGMSEAVGSLYEAVAGLQPLTRWTMPTALQIAPASQPGPSTPTATVAWMQKLPDRVMALGVDNDAIVAVTADQSRTKLQKGGALLGAPEPLTGDLEAARNLLGMNPQAGSALLKQHERPDRMMKLSAASGTRVALAYWGGTLRIVDSNGAIKSEQMLPQDITALVWQGERLVVGLADGRVIALDAP
jgi:hypothetical protein